MPNVAMPNGDVVAFPDDMAPDQIKGMIATKFPDASKQTFLSKVSGDLGSRWQQAQQDVHSYPEMSPIIGAGVAAGSANDVIGQGINAVTPDIVKQGLASGAQSTANALDNTSIGQKIGDTLMGLRDSGEGFMQNNPRSAIALRAAGNAATLLPAIKGAEPLVRGAQEVAENVSNGVKGLSDSYAAKYPVGTAPFDPIQPNIAYQASPAALETAAKLHYNDAESMGGMIKPGGFQDTLNAIKQKVGYQTTEGAALAGENSVTDTINKLDRMQEMPISLRGLDEMDGTLNSKISVAMRAGDNEAASKLLDIKSMLKNASTSLKPEDLVNPEAFDSWRKGDILFSAKSKMKQLQSLVDNAYNTDNPDSAMRSGYRTLSRQLAKNPMGWTPEEIGLINQGAKRGLTASALKTIGGRLISGIGGAAGGVAAGAMAGGPFGAIAGGIIGTGIGEGLGYPMRAAATSMQESRAMAPFAAVASRPSVVKTIQPSISEIMKLPMAQQKEALDAILKTRKIKSAP